MSSQDERNRARARRVNRVADLGLILSGYGYEVHPDPDREQQFRCDLHGDDQKPSARFYPRTNSTYCWVCHKARRAVDYLVEKDGLGFEEALSVLEKQLGLGELSFEEDPDSLDKVQEAIDQSLKPHRDFKDERLRLRKLLESVTQDRDLPAPIVFRYWEVFDRIDYGMHREDWSEDQGKKALSLLKKRLMEDLV